MTAVRHSEGNAFPPTVAAKSSEISLAYSLMETYFNAKKLGDGKLHKILFVSGPIIGFILAFVCFYAIFLGVTEQSNKIFEKKDEEIKLWQMSSDHYRRIHEGSREALIHEKYEDSRLLSEELEKCQHSHAKTIDEVLGLENDLRQSQQISEERLRDIDYFNQRIQEKNEQIQKLANELANDKARIDKMTIAKEIGNVVLMISVLAGIALFAIYRPSSSKY